MVSNPAIERDLEDSHDQRMNQANKYSFFVAKNLGFVAIAIEGGAHSLNLILQ